MSVSEGSLPVLDPRTIRELRALSTQLGEDVLGDVVGAFERSAPGLVRMLAHALQAGDPGRLGHLAHTLRSACMQVGAARLADLAGRLERAASASAPEIASLVPVCAREIQELLSVLAKLTEHEA